MKSTIGHGIVQGTCGFSDVTLVDCGRFYPRKNLTAPEKLSIYSRKGIFGCVEIDSSNYTLLKPEHVDGWVRATPAGFLFHFKAYGLLVNGGMQFKSLPQDVREILGESSPQKYVTLEDIGQGKVQELWDRFHRSLQPAIRSKKMGAVVFQFQLNVVPSNPSSREHIEYCARQLHPDLSMAVEFRNRLWMNEDNLSDTLAWLSTLRPGGVALVSCDDLASEVYGASQLHSDPSLHVVDDHLPVVLNASCCASFAYVRVHRREGRDRVLYTQEIADWVQRISRLYEVENFQGALYFLWGTDWEDQPMINARNLSSALPARLAPKWAEALRSADKQSIRNAFAKASSPIAVEDNAAEITSPIRASSVAKNEASAALSPSVNRGKKRILKDAEFPSPGTKAITKFFKPAV
eukprot:gene30065-36309_t